MAILYRIRDWELHFENNRTREMKTMSWIPLPVKLSGPGYVYLMGLKNGSAIFGCFIASLELAAQSKKRGEFWQTAVLPHSPRSLAAGIRHPETLVEEMLKQCDSVYCDWIEHVEINNNTEGCGEGAGKVRGGCGKDAGKVRSITGEDITIQERIEEDSIAAKPPADPRHKEFIALFSETWTRTRKGKPPIQAKDGMQLKVLLSRQPDVSIDDFKNALFNCDREQFHAKNFGLAYICSQFEKLINLGVVDGKRTNSNSGRFVGAFEKDAPAKYAGM